MSTIPGYARVPTVVHARGSKDSVVTPVRRVGIGTAQPRKRFSTSARPRHDSASDLPLHPARVLSWLPAWALCRNRWPAASVRVWAAALADCGNLGSAYAGLAPD